MLEEQGRFSRIKKYVTAFLILFVTFAIPVTITQIYRGSSSISSSADSLTPTRTIQSFISPSVTQVTNATQTFSESLQAGSSDFLKNYWWTIPIAGGLIIIWVILVIMFIAESKKEMDNANNLQIAPPVPITT